MDKKALTATEPSEMTSKIFLTKTQVKSKVWTERINDCQTSGLSIKEYCRRNSISTKSYYYHLRKIRESLLTENEIVPIDKPEPSSSGEIKIRSGGIDISLPETISSEQLTAILQVLKSC